MKSQFIWALPLAAALMQGPVAAQSLLLFTDDDVAVVRPGDTVFKIAQRYGLTLSELLRLNPGMESARLVVGAPIRLAAPATRSGQPPASIAEVPAPAAPFLPSPADRFSSSLDALVRDGVLDVAERARIRAGSAPGPFNVSAFQAACRSGALHADECRNPLYFRWRGVTQPRTVTSKPLSSSETALLDRIRNDESGGTWRKYGQCLYDWSGWKLHSNGTRTTAADCGGTAMRWTVGVSCSRLLVATHTRSGGWGPWAKPAGPDSKFRAGEDQMVAALCANVAGKGVR